MTLADYVEANRKRLIEWWKIKVRARLALEVEESQLINSLPMLIEDLVATLRNPPEEWPSLDSAAEHGRHRVEMGIDIARLTEELALVGETIVGLACEDEFKLDGHDLQRLFRVIGRATAWSVQAYAGMRDRQLAKEAAQHFSFLAHEIRNPLNNARLAVDLLAVVPEKERDRYFDRVDRALSQLSEQVDNSLVGARLFGQPDMKLQTYDAAELVESAWADVALHGDEREIIMSSELERFEIDADRKLLVSALTNLMSNAVKFSRIGGRIQLRVRARNDRALFQVEDECGGIAESLQQLFLPFVQAEHDRSGFGLGLTIVKQVCEAHHGEVKVENRQGKGCSFTLDLPRRQPSDSAEEF